LPSQFRQNSEKLIEARCDCMIVGVEHRCAVNRSQFKHDK